MTTTTRAPSGIGVGEIAVLPDFHSSNGDEPHQGDGECGIKGRPNQGLRHKCIEAIQGVQPSEAAPVNKAVSIGLGLCAQDD